MSSFITRATWCLLLCVAGLAAHAELQNVSVGGNVLILGEYYRHAYTPDYELRWPALWLWGRPTGGDGNSIFSGYAWDGRAGGLSEVSQWTRLHVSADFTDNVSAFIQFDSVEVWGEDLRSNYVIGLDARPASADDVEVYQAYVDVNELLGSPLRLRLGRQELSFGSEWLVGNNDAVFFGHFGLSFDAVRLTYTPGAFVVDAWWSKLAENSGIEQDGDTDFYGVYASYTGWDGITLDAYWLWLRDALALEDTNSGLIGEWVEDWVGVDDYDPTNLHTIGLRGAGEAGAFDFEAEAAYQWGDAGQAGSFFKPVLYGDNDAEYGAWSAHADLGYTFDTAWAPRVHAAYVYLGGEDNRGITFGEWVEALLNPFYRGSSISFNRLFSDVYFSNLLDGTDLSNAHIMTVGMSASPTDSLECSLEVTCLRADEPFARPVLPVLGFLSRENGRDLGWETYADLTYQYTDDLYFSVGWSHLFAGDGLRHGHFMQSNGLDFNGGTDGDDADYLFFQTEVSF